MSRNSSQKRLGLIFVGIGVVLLLLSIAGFFLIERTLLQQLNYPMGSCTITAKGLKEILTTRPTSYTPHFEYTLHTTDGKNYAASGYDGLNTSISNVFSAQAIVNQYTVGHTYPCWYDPSDPTHAILVRQTFSPLLFIPGFFLLIGGLCVLVGVLLLLGRIKTWSSS